MRIKLRVLFFIVFVLNVFFYLPVFPSSLDNIYGPLLSEDTFFYSGDVEYFGLREEGIHGNVSYDKFNSNPYFYSIDNSLRFLAFSIDINMGFKELSPSKYKRLTYAAVGNLSEIQRYNIDYFSDVYINTKMRKDAFEFYLNILSKRQKSNWMWESLSFDLGYFSYIKAHYEEIKGGFRYITESDSQSGVEDFSRLTSFLLSNNQHSFEVGLEYRQGDLTRHTIYNLVNRNYNFYHNLWPHYTPKMLYRYGLSNNLEIESGIAYITPLKYEYRYRRFNSDNTSLFVDGNYEIKHSFLIPLRFKHQLTNRFRIIYCSDFNFKKQELDYWKKNTDDTISFFERKKLNYYNINPSLELIYFDNKDKLIEQNSFSSFFKTLLRKNQYLIRLKYQKDITHLKKNFSNGMQNIIDPYNVFMYPLDYFVTGSEFATFSAGNASTYATNIAPQNYYQLSSIFTYGLKDTINIGLGGGYHSASSLHSFTLNDMRNRFYRFKSYYFFDFLFDYQLNDSSLFSVNGHFVPEYVTRMILEGAAQEYKSKTSYFGVSCGLKILF